MSPRYPHTSRYTDPAVDSYYTTDYTSTTAEIPWWSIFQTRPVLSERVTQLVKSTSENTSIRTTQSPQDTSQTTAEDQSAIINALQFSRWLGIYYNIAILLFPIAVFAIRRSAEKAKRWRKARSKRKLIKQNEVVVESTSNSSSSSSSATDVLIDGADESKPLLPPSSRTSRTTLIYRRIKGYMSYQPPNDFRGRVRPSNGVSIGLNMFCLFNLFLSIYWIYFPLDTTSNSGLRVFLMADRFGIVFTMNQPLNYLLAAKTSPLKYLTGWSYEQLNIFHRQLSGLCYYLSILHFVGMYGVFLIFIARTGESFLHILSRPDILIGVISFTSFFFFNIVSKDEIREKVYEFFLATHIIFSATAMGFLYFHHPTTRIYVVLSLSIWIIDRIAYRMLRKRWKAEAVVEKLDESTVRVTISNVGAGRGRGWEWEPASHIFLTVPEYSRWQAHPFTILSPPPGYDLSFNDGTSELEHNKEMVLVIRKLQGFSAGLLHLADPQRRVKAIIDGPYGSNHAREILEKSRKSVLIAGGSGIAVAWPLMIEVIRKRIDKAKAGKLGKPRKIVLLWIVQFEHHLQWVHDDLEELERLKRERILPRCLEVEVKKFVTKGPNGRRPDLKQEIEEVIEDEDAVAGRGGHSTLVVCGPDGMVRDVRASGYDLLWKGRDVEVVAEKFGW